jgi:predicted GNAT family acetyltransferase
VAFAQLEHDGGSAEISQVYVHPEHRGTGLGTATTSAAIAAAGDVTDLWICADAEDRAKDLYTQLGFRAAWTVIELQREV